MKAVKADPELQQRQLRTSVVGRLLIAGSLHSEQYQAAIEIHRVWTAVTRALFARVQSYERLGRVMTPTDWTPSLTRAYRDRYAPWRDEASQTLVRHRQTTADVVFLVAVDNCGCRQVADRLHMDQRRVLRIVQNSLWRYAEIAEWIEQKKSA
ncbi:MAG TPA: hypothetical protein VMA37_08840 [Acetobacteraceae bacterium]|nr:hypothetical protein [Acetobacteraceae bacterium]